MKDKQRTTIDNKKIKISVLSSSLTDHLKKKLNMLPKCVFNDIQNNITVNYSRSKHENFTLNTPKMVVWIESKRKFHSI